MLGLIRDLTCLQLDPINVVARSHLLVLWSRLGKYDPAVLDQLLWQDRRLFEYWAHAASIVLTEDYPLYRALMRNYQKGNSLGGERARKWMTENRALRRLILSRLTADGPLLSRQFEDKSMRGWESTGWTNERNVSRMLDFLWTRGEIMVAGRVGGQKLWDLSERCLPEWTPRERLTDRQVTERAVLRSLSALGVARPRDITYYFLRWRYTNLKEVLASLARRKQIQRVAVVADAAPIPGEWYVRSEDMQALEAIESSWEPRTTLLSPFDSLIAARPRTEQLFEFSFRTEIYVPKEKRQFGYYLLPILSGDRIIGRIDAAMDRKASQFLVKAVHAEVGAPDDIATGRAVGNAIGDLAEWLGASDVVYSGGSPAGWGLGRA